VPGPDPAPPPVKEPPPQEDSENPNAPIDEPEPVTPKHV
jgi:hypothetical protein